MECKRTMTWKHRLACCLIVLLPCMTATASGNSDCTDIAVDDNTHADYALQTDEEHIKLIGTDTEYPRRGSQCLVLHNRNADNIEMALYLDNPRIDHVELVSCDEASDSLRAVAGTTYPLTQWQSLGGELFFRISLSPDSRACYRINIGAQGPYNSRLQLLPTEPLLRTLSQRHVMTGLLGGLIAGLVLYTFFLGISSRESTYLYLSCSTAAVAIMHVCDLGTLYPLWPQSPYWNQICSPTSSVMSSLLGSCLVRRYMLLSTAMPRTDKIIDLYAWWLLLMALPIAVSNHITVLITTYGISAVLFMVALIAISIVRIRQGYEPAKLYLVAILLPITAGIGTFLDYTGVFTTSSLSRLIPLASTALQLMLFALALGERINWLGNEQKRIRQQTLLTETETLAKKTFLTHISHELRTPLTGIIGLTTIINRDKLRNSEKILLEGIGQSAHHLLDTTNALLDHARIDAGKWVVEKQAFNLHALLQRVTEKHRTAASNKNLNITCHAHQNIPEQLLGDAAVIEKVLHYIIDNSIKFTHSGGIVLMAEATDSADDSVTVRIDILDTGIGFDELFKARAFELFELADHSTTRNQQGLGLGLSLSRKLCALLGGEIGCDSKPGHGTVFWCRIPLQRPDISKAATDIKPDTHHAPSSHRRQQILVAEDDEAIRAIIAAQLDQLGRQYALFADGKPLVADYMARHRDIACLLLDWNMPVYNARTTLDAIRQFESEKDLPAVPVIIMSAYDPQATRTLPIPDGTPVLHKPVNATQLQQALASVRAP